MTMQTQEDPFDVSDFALDDEPQQDLFDVSEFMEPKERSKAETAKAEKPMQEQAKRSFEQGLKRWIGYSDETPEDTLWRRSLASGLSFGASEKGQMALTPEEQETWTAYLGKMTGETIDVAAASTALSTGLAAIGVDAALIGGMRILTGAAKTVEWVPGKTSLVTKGAETVRHLASAGLAMAGYDATEKTVKTGELPSPSEFASNAAYYMGLNAAFGLGGKVAGTAGKALVKSRMGEPTAKFVQKGLKNLGNFFDYTGKPIDLVAKVRQFAAREGKPVHKVATGIANDLKEKGVDPKNAMAVAEATQNYLYDKQFPSGVPTGNPIPPTQNIVTPKRVRQLTNKIATVGSKIPEVKPPSESQLVFGHTPEEEAELEAFNKSKYLKEQHEKEVQTWNELREEHEALEGEKRLQRDLEIEEAKLKADQSYEEWKEAVEEANLMHQLRLEEHQAKQYVVTSAHEAAQELSAENTTKAIQNVGFRHPDKLSFGEKVQQNLTDVKADVRREEDKLYGKIKKVLGRKIFTPTRTIDTLLAIRGELGAVPDFEPAEYAKALKTLNSALKALGYVEDAEGGVVTSQSFQQVNMETALEVYKRLAHTIDFETLDPKVQKALSPAIRVGKEEIQENLTEKQSALFKEVENYHAENAKKFNKDTIRGVRSTDVKETIAGRSTEPSYLRDLKAILPEHQFREVERETLEAINAMSLEKAEDTIREVSHYLTDDAKQACDQILTTKRLQGKKAPSIGKPPVREKPIPRPEKKELPKPYKKQPFEIEKPAPLKEPSQPPKFEEAVITQRRALRDDIVRSMAARVVKGTRPENLLKMYATTEGRQNIRAALKNYGPGKEIEQYLDYESCVDVLNKISKDGILNPTKFLDFMSKNENRLLLKEILPEEAKGFFRDWESLGKNTSRNFEDLMSMNRVKTPMGEMKPEEFIGSLDMTVREALQYLSRFLKKGKGSISLGVGLYSTGMATPSHSLGAASLAWLLTRPATAKFMGQIAKTPMKNPQYLIPLLVSLNKAATNEKMTMEEFDELP